MGKVGSTAIYNSLSPKFNDVYQVHSLVPAKLKKTTHVLTEKGLGVPRHVKDSQYIIDNYLSKDSPVRIITPIRSPLQRNMSAFFQELGTEIMLKDEFRKGLGIPSSIKLIRYLPFLNEWKNLLIQKIIQPRLHSNIDFLINYFKSNYRHTIPLNWFDDEFNKALNIDVYKSEFNNKLGYNIYRQEQIKVLVFLAELSNETKSRIIGEFAGATAITINSVHSSEAKSYGKAYQLFKEKLQLDDECSALYASSNYVKKFYAVNP